MVSLRSIEISQFGLPSRCTKHVLRRRVFEKHRLDSSSNYRNDRFGSVAVIAVDSGQMAALGANADIHPG